MTNATQSALRGRPRSGDGKDRTTFGGIDKSAVRPTSGPSDYNEIHASAEFRALRNRIKYFVFPMTALFLVWYVLYVVVAAYASDFMAQPLWGEINVGLVMGVGQFVTTLGITALYVRFARKYIDPQVDAIRRDADGAQQ